MKLFLVLFIASTLVSSKKAFANAEMMTAYGSNCSARVFWYTEAADVSYKIYRDDIFLKTV